MANHLVDGTETKLSHDGSELIGHVVEEVDDMLGGSLELLSQLGVLGGDTNRASVHYTIVSIKTS